jgi:hypothetical protein
MAVNIANGVYSYRFWRTEFSFLKNVLVPVAGFALNAYLLRAAFFSALWSTDVRMGKSVVVGCIALLAAEIIAVVYMRLRSADLFSHGAPMGADGESGAHSGDVAGRKAQGDAAAVLPRVQTERA